jgi:hypothetical protein
MTVVPDVAMAEQSERASRAEAILAELVKTLRWDDAPPALRAVLPLARLLRRLSAIRRRAVGDVQPAPSATVPPPPRSVAKRLAIRGYLLTRPVALPVARRLHSLLGVLLERESFETQRVQAGTHFAASADGELLRSIEAAMLTLALQPRDRRA